MITVFRSNQVHSLSELKAQIKRQLEQLPRIISSIGDAETIYRFEYDCEKIDLLAWLHNQTTPQKVYWSGRDGLFEMAGISTADLLEGKGPFDYRDVFDQAQRKLSADNKNLRYYGGFCFDAPSVNEDWSLFGSYRLVVPRFEIDRYDQRHTFSVNIHIKDIAPDPIKEIIQELDLVDFSGATHYRAVPKILSRDDKPSADRWNQIFKDVANDSLEKIVLARRTDFDFDVKIRPSALIRFLKEQTPNCFHFCFQPDRYNGFLGASPERLFKMDGLDLYTEAVAGTTPRGDSTDQTRVQEEKLLYNEKFQREHGYVVDHIKTVLQQLCSRFHFSEKPELLKLKNGQHLITRFEGALKSNFAMDDVLKTIHPTPAVAGYPVKGVMGILAKNEPFARGWYAGPVGYIGYEQCEFAVGIRSGLIRGNRLSLYAGAGIVEGSTAQEEWSEIENKISRFMKVFNS